VSTARLPASDRRRQLVEAALDLFSRRGFQGATTKEIAAAAGVTEAIIFRHFPNKQALYNAVLDYHHESGQLEACVNEWKSFMDANDDSGLFRSLIRHMIVGYRHDARVKRALLFAALEGHQTGLAEHRNRALPIFEPVFHYIERRQSEGALRAIDPTAVIIAVISVADHYGMLTEFFGFSTGLTDEEVTEDFLDIVLHGLMPATAPQAPSTSEKENP
jgi:TetR/AcrR family transcriptional regulator